MHDLSLLVMVLSLAVVSGALLVESGNHCTYGLVLVETVVVGVKSNDHHTTHLKSKSTFN